MDEAQASPFHDQFTIMNMGRALSILIDHGKEIQSIIARSFRAVYMRFLRNKFALMIFAPVFLSFYFLRRYFICLFKNDLYTSLITSLTRC